MFKKSNEIEFVSSTDYFWELAARPIPASSVVPDWWKNMQPHSTHDNKLRMNPGPTVTAKKCFPLLDGITAGYIFPLWSDVMVNTDPKLPLVQWGPSQPVFDSWNASQIADVELPKGYSKTVLKYLHGWIIKTPPGWSCLVTHPIGYPNLPFRVIPGVVDTDTLTTGINTPIVIKEGFEGIIEKGTPMFQVIPVKRENWESKVTKGDENTFNINHEKLKTTIVGSYGKNTRSSKKFT